VRNKTEGESDELKTRGEVESLTFDVVRGKLVPSSSPLPSAIHERLVQYFDAAVARREKS